MTVIKTYLNYIFLLIVLESVTVQSSKCDSSLRSSSVLEEGVIGQASTFSWLGVLEVYLREVGSISTALTGIVLVKPEFAIANADDVAKIPKHIFQKDSKAMFIPRYSQPWYCRPKDYITHPEYDRTVNTIALVQLDPGTQGENRHRGVLPILPICWPKYPTSKELYIVGFTDDNGPLEKVIYKANYLDQKTCVEFYNRANLTDGEMLPVSYHCAFARNLRESCVWDNGMALVSNATGHWVLVGLGVLGPGCESPARYIDMTPHYPWIETSTTRRATDESQPVRGSQTGQDGADEIKDLDGDSLISRRSGDYRMDFENEFAKRGYNTMLAIPMEHKHLIDVHFTPVQPRDLLTSWNYPGSVGSVHTEDYVIDRLDKDAIKITKIKGQYGNCGAESNRLIYHDETKIKAPLEFQPQQTRFAVYKISLYDLHFLHYSCVILKVKSPSQEQALLYYRPVISTTDESSRSAGTTFSQKTPEEIIKTYTLIQPGSRPQKPGEAWRPGPNLRPVSVQDNTDRLIQNVNLYIRFAFFDSASFVIRIYGPPRAAKVQRPTTAKREKYTTPTPL